MKVIAKFHCFVSKNHYICRVLETKRAKMDFLTFRIEKEGNVPLLYEN